ncbi:heme-binding domain-containing protein [uncultured Draconibacterium sp.]|uniref:heme-binding domain-containing protein n=1 Tax=uncultured Draconibacterium sp. TaxID=1573823 RepID=UPI003217071A
MKKKSILSVLFVGLFMIVLVAKGDNEPTKTATMPDDVKAVIEKSCFGCHNTDSRNEDAKKELDFKKLDELSTIKKIGTYKEIGETLEKGEMPPKKFLERFPDKQISDDEKKLLMDWSKKEAEALVKTK